MVRGRWRSLGVAFAVAGLLGLAVNGWAQATTGGIRGKVTDAEGNPVPGATIKITSPGLLGDRTTYSLDNGAYNFAAIPTGTYTMETSLAGFAPSRVENVTVGLGQTRDVDIKMTLQSVTQEIQVVGEAPQLDTTSNETGGRVEYEELIKVPTARDPWAVLNLIPSVQTDRINVGASESGQQSTFVSKGDDGDGAVWNVDGVNITDQAAIGASPTYYDFGAIEEIQVTTGGTDASMMTGGVGINIVTKRGSNDIKGSARTFFSNDSLQADNSPDPEELRATYTRFLADQVLEFGAEVGFPIIKDRLWGWVSGNRNKIENVVRTTVIVGPPRADQPDNTELINYGGKLNAQIVKNNEASFLYEFGDKQKQGRNASVTRPAETTWNQKGGSPLMKIEDQHIFGSNLILAAKYGWIAGGFSLTPEAGGTYESQDTSAFRDFGTVWHGTFQDHANDRPSRNLTLTGNYFATTGNVDHEFKAGFSYRGAEVVNDTFWPSGSRFVEVAADGTAVVFFEQSLHNESSETQYAFYAQDTLNFGKVTLNLGARWDSQKVASDGGFHPAHPRFPDLLPRKDFAATDSPFTWNNITPRIGLNYEIDEKTVAKASYAMYVDNLGLDLAIQANPAYITSSLVAYGVDTNGDGYMDNNELITDLYGPYGPDPTAAEFGNLVDEDLKSPKTHEVVLALDRQFGPDFVIGVSGSWRQRYDETWFVPMVNDGGADRVATRADFAATNVLAGTFTQDGELNAYAEPYFRLVPGVTTASRNFVTTRPDYQEDYLGLDLSANKRFSNNWLFGASFSVSDWKMKYDPNGEGAFPDPTATLTNPCPDTGECQIAIQSTGSGAKGNVFMNANWQSSFRAAYSLEMGPGNLELGTNVTYRQGYPIPVEDSRGQLALRSGQRNILVSELDDFRHDNPFIADFRLAYTPTFGRVNLEFGVDVFNAFNSDIVLQQRREGNLAAFGSPTEVVGPRMFRLGARVTF